MFRHRNTPHVYYNMSHVLNRNINYTDTHHVDIYRSMSNISNLFNLTPVVDWMNSGNNLVPVKTLSSNESDCCSWSLDEDCDDKLLLPPDDTDSISEELSVKPESWRILLLGSPASMRRCCSPTRFSKFYNYKDLFASFIQHFVKG